METLSATPRNASRLILKALMPRPNPHRDDEYRELLRLYAGNYDFRELTKEIAYGFGLKIIYGTQFGLILGATGTDSRCAVKLTDINPYFSEVEKGVILITMIIMTIAFFPTAQDLEDIDFAPKPREISDVLYVLNRYIERFNLDQNDDPESTDDILKPGWRVLAKLPEDDEAQSKKKDTRAGLLRIVKKFLVKHGFIEVDINGDVEMMNATKRFQYHARELLVHDMFEWLITNNPIGKDRQ